MDQDGNIYTTENGYGCKSGLFIPTPKGGLLNIYQRTPGGVSEDLRDNAS